MKKYILMLMVVSFGLKGNFQAQETIVESELSIVKNKVARSAKSDNLDSSMYTDNERIIAESGMYKIQVDPQQMSVDDKQMRSTSSLKNQEIYYSLDEEGTLSAGSLIENQSEDTNITVYNGEIVDSENAFVITSGGYNTEFMMYETIDDLKTNTNGVPMSGGAFYGQYLGSSNVDGTYVYHVEVSGFNGYVLASNMQIVPEVLASSQSYYQVEEDSLVYYSAIDSLTSDEYERIEIGTAPDEMAEDVKYYSSDDVNFSTTNISLQSSVSYNSYFMNLPFRSESNYTAAKYKAYLNAKGFTNSQYFSETSAFVKAQTNEGINSLLLFSMANHESSYGRSSYANACYNFFGRGAIDSDPDQACQYYSYKTATDGILAQALFLQNGYFDILDYRYSGTHVGNKASGINVYYASDPDWGKKISNHAYMMDQYGGNKNENKESIIKVTGAKHVYQDENFKTKIASSSDSTKLSYYDLSAMAGTTNTVNVVAKAMTDDGYLIQVPTAVKNNSKTICSYTTSKQGSYPLYGGRSEMSVATGSANYSCPYSSYSTQLFWITKANTTKIFGPTVSSLKTIETVYYDSGVRKAVYTYDAVSGEVKSSIHFNKSGKIIRRRYYYSGATDANLRSKLKYDYIINPGTNTVSQGNVYKNGSLIRKYVYNSGTKFTKRSSNIKYTYYFSNGNLTKSYTFNSKGQKTYFTKYRKNTTYASRNKKKYIRYRYVAGSTTIKDATTFNTNGIANKIYVYQSNTKYGETRKKASYKQVYWLNNNGYIRYSISYKNGREQNKYYYISSTKYNKYTSDRVRKTVSL